MINYVEGSLLESPAKVLVNPVNTQGAMGKGLAGEFKKLYPEMFRQYQDLCERKLLIIGTLWIYKTPNKWILNFPTKASWRQKSQPQFIEAGLKKFVDTYSQKGIHSIAFPQLGCGNGELDWEKEVRPLMDHYLHELPIEVYIHIFGVDNDVPEHRAQESVRHSMHREPRSIPFSEFWNDLEKLVSTIGTFRTLDRDVPFQVSIAQGGTGLDIYPLNNAVPIRILKEDGGFLELWQYFRAAHYLLPTKLPDGLDAYGPFLIGLLSHLDYVRTVKIARHNEPAFAIGLQLIADLEDHEMNKESIVLEAQAS